jgi:hypothetical protein
MSHLFHEVGGANKPRYQVTKHVFTLATRKLESSKVGNPCKRTKAQDLCDNLNDKQGRASPTPETEGQMISYTTSLVKDDRPIHASQASSPERLEG